jgi:hypothetical protein
LQKAARQFFDTWVSANGKLTVLPKLEAFITEMSALKARGYQEQFFPLYVLGDERRNRMGKIKQVQRRVALFSIFLGTNFGKAPLEFLEGYRDRILAGKEEGLGFQSEPAVGQEPPTVEAKAGKGGIDLNPAQMSMQVKKDGQDFKFDFNGTEIDAAQVTGATFTIRTMTPVVNLGEILGLSQKSADSPFRVGS